MMMLPPPLLMLPTARLFGCYGELEQLATTKLQLIASLVVRGRRTEKEDQSQLIKLYTHC